MDIVSKVENVVLGEDEAISTRVINMQLNFYFWLHIPGIHIDTSSSHS